jgi:ferritin-like metal-binding protein YciE
MELSTLTDVLADQIEDLYSAENQLVDALPGVAAAADDPKLREAFEHHLEQTREHVRRLASIFDELGVTAPSEYCEGMAGLISEEAEVADAAGSCPAKDAALIAAAQRIEHYEIAAYGAARALAAELGLGDIKHVLTETLDEESAADSRLTEIATGGLLRSGINAAAARR